MLTDLPEEVESWLQDHQDLSKLIDKIRNKFSTDDEIARALYYEGADLFQLRKSLVEEESDNEAGMADDDDDDTGSERVSLFETLATLNFFHPDENVVDKVLISLYIASSGQEMDKEQAALMHYGDEEAIPRPYFIFFFGKDIDARMSFDNPGGENAWPDSGAVGVIQVGL